jgi:hypothetical protein
MTASGAAGPDPGRPPDLAGAGPPGAAGPTAGTLAAEPDAAGRSGPYPAFRAVAAVLAVFAGLALALLASHSGPPFSSTPAPQGTVQTIAPAPAPTNTGRPVDRGQDQPPPRTFTSLTWLYILVAAGLLFLGGSAIPLFLPRRPRWRWWSLGEGRAAPPRLPRPTAVPRVEQELASVVDTALARLDGGPVGDAIVACWLGLERAAAQVGTPRRAAETSAELTERVLAEHRVSPQTLRRLAALYREARFSRHRLGEEVRDEARELFERVRDELRVTA